MSPFVTWFAATTLISLVVMFSGIETSICLSDPGGWLRSILLGDTIAFDFNYNDSVLVNYDH